MNRLPCGRLMLSASDVDGLKCMLLAEQRRVVDIHATTFSAINDLVFEWERVHGPLPELYR